MADEELEKIRAQRLSQLQSQFGQGKNSEEDASRQEEAKLMKNSLLSQILDQSARARLNTILVAKPDKGQRVENLLLSMAQTGQIGGRLSESDLIGLLERVSEQGSLQKRTTVKFDRRRAALDDDDEDF